MDRLFLTIANSRNVNPYKLRKTENITLRVKDGFTVSGLTALIFVPCFISSIASSGRFRIIAFSSWSISCEVRGWCRSGTHLLEGIDATGIS